MIRARALAPLRIGVHVAGSGHPAWGRVADGCVKIMSNVRMKTLHGPMGARLVLDRSKVVPEDPGADTPAVVYWKRYSGTLWCCWDTGEIDCGAAQLPQPIRDWLDEMIDVANEFLYQEGGVR